MPGAGVIFAVPANAVFQRFAFGEVTDVVHCDFRDVVHGFFREECLMRSHKNIRERHQPRQYIVRNGFVRTVLEKVVCLLLIHVKPRAADSAFFERIDQRLRIDQYSRGWY